MVWSRLSLVLVLLLTYSQAAADTVMLEFTSPTCGPCRAMRPVMQQMAKLGYDVREVDTSREPGLELAKKFRVDSLPTFVVLVDNQERARLVGGGNSAAKLVEMITTANAIAAKAKLAAAATPLSKAVDGADINFTGSDAEPNWPDPTGPQPGRVVPVDVNPPVSRPSTSTRSSSDDLIRATVRVSVDDPEGKSTGTGTIVDAREGKALVLTCGHLFRSSNGNGAIEISLFTPGPNGAELLTTVEGTIVDFDLDRDLALVCFWPEGEVTVAPIAPVDVEMKVGDAATAVGCAHGANPEPWATQITAIDRYAGAPNIEAARAPVEGRSGGGLFNAAGQLVGVCNAADPERNEGLYAALGSIRAKLDALQLSSVYLSPSLGAKTGQAFAMPVAATASPFEVRGQNPTPTPSSAFPGLTRNGSPQGGLDPVASAERSSAASGAAVVEAATGQEPLSPQERATLEEIARRGAGSDVICIISPREPGGQSEVIKINAASPALLKALAAAGGSATAAAPSSGQTVVR
jgi:thiol-disulfide isomerase/thioredoxin